jgi:hypothetical protein
VSDAYSFSPSADAKYNGHVYVSNRIHRRGPLRSPGGIQGPAIAGATKITLTDAMRGTDTWESYLDSVAGPPFPTTTPTAPSDHTHVTTGETGPAVPTGT